MDKNLKDIDDKIHKIDEEIKWNEDINRRNEKNFAKEQRQNKIGLIIPPALTIGFMTFLCSALGATPFKRDSHTVYLKQKTELDNLGNISYEEQYKDFPSKKDTITYVGKWQKGDDGIYFRNVTIYDADKVKQDAIENIVKVGNKKAIEDLSASPLVVHKERQKNITDEELNMKPYIMATIYSEDKSQYTVVKETATENMNGTMFYMMSLSLLLLVVTPIDVSFYLDNKREAKFNFAHLNRADRIDELRKLKSELEKQKEKNIEDENIKKLN